MEESMDIPVAKQHTQSKQRGTAETRGTQEQAIEQLTRKFASQEAPSIFAEASSSKREQLRFGVRAVIYCRAVNESFLAEQIHACTLYCINRHFHITEIQQETLQGDETPANAWNAAQLAIKQGRADIIIVF